MVKNEATSIWTLVGFQQAFSLTYLDSGNTLKRFKVIKPDVVRELFANMDIS